jgi:tetratricopeptide (TPR) repeat protein
MRRAALVFSIFSILSLSGWAQHSAELPLKDGLQLCREQQYVTLFERANDAVREDPRSVEGHFFLGLALQQGEGNLPLARRSLETAKGLLDREKANGKLTETDSEVYRRTLGALADIYETTEQYTEELRLIDLARREANLDWSATRGWPLMKLGRMDEARAAMRESLKSTDPVDRRIALNTLGSLEFSAWNYEASYSWFTLLIAQSPPDDLTPTTFSNRAETALALENFAGAESDYRQATDRFQPGSYTNPWEEITPLYVQTGRLVFAVSAIQKMRAWDAGSDPTLEQNRWSREQLIVGLVQLAAGRDQQAMDTTALLLRRPDRLGNNSASPQESEIASLDLYVEALRRNRERAIESLSWSGPLDWCRGLGRAAMLTAELWVSESRLRAMVVRNPDGLDWSLRPYGPNSDVQEYLRPGMNGILGPGVVSSAVAKLLQRSGPLADRERPYLQCMLGESMVDRGEFKAALAPLSSSLQTMPREESLLRSRTEALLGYALEHTGAGADAQTHYSSAMQLDPHVFRSLAIAVPVTIERAPGDDAAANLAASWLRSSPRFRQGRGFTIQFQRYGTTHEAVILGSSGEVMARAATSANGKPKEIARQLCAAIHDSFFNGNLNVEQADIDSINGSPASLDARQLSLDTLLGGRNKE